MNMKLVKVCPTTRAAIPLCHYPPFGSSAVLLSVAPESLIKAAVPSLTSSHHSGGTTTPPDCRPSWGSCWRVQRTCGLGIRFFPLKVTAAPLSFSSPRVLLASRSSGASATPVTQTPARQYSALQQASIASSFRNNRRAHHISCHL